jgi:glycosyltransferase involved in cell wall biosynthesis
MRVMLISGALPPAQPHCGVSDAVVKLAHGLADRGLEVAVLTSSRSPSHIKSMSGKRVEVFNIIDTWGFQELPKIMRSIKSWSPDVIHIQYPTQDYGWNWMPYCLPTLLFFKRYKVVQTWHETTRFRFLPNLFSIDSLIVVEPDFTKKLRKRYKWAMFLKRIQFIQIVSNIDRVILSEKERHEVRRHWADNDSRLVVFFGFVYPGKGFEKIFHLADPSTDTLIVIGDLDFQNNEYHARFKNLIESEQWVGRIKLTGYLEGQDVAKLLAVADAILCPFDSGMRVNNGTVLAGRAQGTFVLTTEKKSRGYSSAQNMYVADCSDLSEMADALQLYSGRRLRGGDKTAVDWSRFVDDHIKVYRKVCARY